jgi:predicted nucleic acid-binding protein
MYNLWTRPHCYPPSFNVTLGHVWAEQEHLLEDAGQWMRVEDGYIASTARRHGLTIVTGNDKDFRRPGLKVFNPFTEDDPVP